MTDTIIDVPAPPPAIDVEISNFRSQHDEALNSRAHPDHNVRTQQFTALYGRKFGGGEPAPVEPPSGQLAHTVNAIPELVGGNEPAGSLTDEPITQASEVDFSRLKGKQIAGVEPDEALENVAKEWVVAGGLNQIEAEALSLTYAASMDADVERAEMLAEQHLRSKYGPDYRAAATAALKVADETFGLRDFVDQNPAFAANPQVIDKLVRAAEKRGYFKKGMQND